MKKSSLIAAVTIMILSVAAGSLYMMLCAPADSIHSYINEFLWNLKSGVRSKNIFINALRENIVTFALIVLCSFVRFGFALSLFAAARRCFISGFTAAAFMRGEGFHGFVSAAVIEIPFMLSLPAIAFLCAMSVSLSVSGTRLTKAEAIPYITAAAAAAALLCAAALAEGYLIAPLLSWIG